MRIKFLVILAILSCCFTSCRNNKAGSTDSMQPVEVYPFVDDIEVIRQILEAKCLDTIEFKKGEVIADIGAGNGTIEAMLSIFHDSLSFYVQDIDTSVCNQKAINEVVDFYQNVRKQPFTNTFFVVAGGDYETNLPDDTFDKILMLWTFQYFKYPQSIMTDLRLKLKPNGLMYIINPDVDYESGKELKSENGWNASTIENEINDIINCGFELVRFSRNYNGSENPYVMVFKKKRE